VSIAIEAFSQTFFASNDPAQYRLERLSVVPDGPCAAGDTLWEGTYTRVVASRLSPDDEISLNETSTHVSGLFKSQSAPELEDTRQLRLGDLTIGRGCSSADAMKVLIVGAGIGGLTAAIALRRAGIDAEVFERAPQLLDVGAGISLWPNAVKGLDKLGVGPPVRAAAVASYVGGIHTWRGALLAPADADEVAREFGAPMVILHRADLLATLHRAAGPETVRLGVTATAFREDTDGVSLALEGGETARGAALIGADGIRSTIRGQLFPDAKPRFAGQKAWRGVVGFAAPPGAGFWGETWGAGARFGLLPMVNDRVYWYATRNAIENEPEMPDGRRAELLRLFGSWHAPIGALIAATDEGAILRNDLYDLPPMQTWSRGRVTLLGDAAHATTPNLGQGGCQAIEDAVVLARALSQTADVEAALQAYEAQRIARANRIIELSRRVGVVGNWRHPLARALRDTLTRLTPRWARLRSLRPIVGYDV
jgi:2-polyprenyl-6-methoxyphenol hydroxylase-like FAD-dependent oxidoreductase